MAELAIETRRSYAVAKVRVIDWVLANREVLAVGAIMAVAAVLRFWDLGARALHHDESLHAQFTYNFSEGDGYRHDPLMHGPFLFHVGALVFFLFGASDFSARIPAALFGTVLVGMPYLLRRQIGIKAVIIAAVLLAFSPTILYFSRFDRNELFMLVWTFAMVICIWRYLEEQRPLYLYSLAALLALSFATKEVAFITAAILLVFINLMLAVELTRGGKDETVSWRTHLRSLALLPFAWLIAAAWPLLGRRPFGRDRLPPVGDVLIVLGTLTLPQLAAVVGSDGYLSDAETMPRTVFATDFPVHLELSLSVVHMTLIALIAAGAYVGLLWRPKVWLIAAAAFFVPFILLFTTFFTNQPPPWTGAFWEAEGGVFSGIWGSLDYWLDQQDVRRGSQPVYYYALLTPLYEFLPLVLALGGALWLALRGDSLRRWLLFWTAGIFIGLTLAGEKMPWLESHIALPLALVAAVALAGALDALEFRERRWLAAAATAALTGLAVLLLVEGGGTLLPLLGWALLAGLLAWLLASAFRGGQEFGRVGLTIAVAALFALTVRAGVTASFTNDDTPTELLVYTQTAPDVPALRDRIDTLAAESGLGRNLPIVVDNADGFAWPWAWYLREYNSVSFISVASPDYEPPAGAVLLISGSHLASIDPSGYDQSPYKHRWWFAETYRGLTFSSAASTLTSADGLRGLGDFFINRRPLTNATSGSTDAVAFFPTDLAGFDAARPPAAPAPEPLILADGRIVIGRPGGGEGELQQPAGLFVDGEGSIWVADTRNGRVQKFDAEGRFLAAAGRSLGGATALSEPWSVAVDEEGFVYIADTWNHRIVKLSPALELVATWGRPAAGPEVGPLDLFGPRDIVFAADGSLWVTDTGNKRLVHFSRDGSPLGAFGDGGAALSQFAEPVGLARDAEGRFLVADTWNGRIQRFDAGFAAPVAFAMDWTSQDVAAKPYLAVLADGRILASEPETGSLRLLAADGAALGTWQPEAGALPLGVAALADGGFVFSDGGRGQVQIVPARLLDDLFR